MIVDGKEEKQYDEVGEYLIFSPNSQRMAYNARLGKNTFVVVDGKEGKPYNGTGTPAFSLDSKHVIYGVKAGNQTMIIVDDKEGRSYDGVLKKEKETGIFISAGHFTYLALKGPDIYLVDNNL